LQVALGGWVSSNYAVMACPDFPLCHGSIAPRDMDFENAFTLWRDLGMTGGEGAHPIPFPALVAVHWVHRVFAIIAAAVVAWFAWRACRHPSTRSAGLWLACLLVVQLLTGMSNIVFQWPLLLAVTHNAGAAAMIAVVVSLNYRLWQQVPEGEVVASTSTAPARAAE